MRAVRLRAWMSVLGRLLFAWDSSARAGRRLLSDACATQPLATPSGELPYCRWATQIAALPPRHGMARQGPRGRAQRCALLFAYHDPGRDKITAWTTTGRESVFVLKPAQVCFCKEGWICEQHADRGWPHDDCGGRGCRALAATPTIRRECPKAGSPTSSSQRPRRPAIRKQQFGHARILRLRLPPRKI